MNDQELKARILQMICEIAPEADATIARDEDDIRETFDLDSMDFVNLVVAMTKQPSSPMDTTSTDRNRKHRSIIDRLTLL